MKLSSVVLLCLILGVLLVGLLDLVHQDEAVFLTVGKGWNRGLLPYRDLFDHKPPGIYLVARGITGMISGWPAVLVARLLTLVVNVLTALILSVLAQRYMSPKIDRLLLIFAYLALSKFFHGHFFMTATFANFALCTCWLAYMHWLERQQVRWLIISGLCLGLTGLFKQPYLFQALVFALILLGHRSKLEWKQLLIWLASFSLSWVVWWLYAWQQKILPEAWFAIISFHKSYEAARWVELVPWLLLLWLPLPMVAVALCLGLRDSVTLIQTRNISRKTFLIALLFLTALLMLPFVIFRPYHHYWFQLLPAVVLLSGYAIKSRPRLAYWLRLNLILVSLVLVADSLTSRPHIFQQLESVRPLSCEVMNLPYQYALTNCLPTQKYFFQVK